MARTVEHYVGQAKAALEAGFTSEAARKRAQEDVTRAWDIERHNLECTAGEVYGWGWKEFSENVGDLPLYVHQAAKKLAALKKFDIDTAVAEGLLALRNEIKAAALVKSEREVKKAEKEALIAQLRNEKVRAFMETHVRPELERMHRESIGGWFDHLWGIYGHCFADGVLAHEANSAVCDIIKGDAPRATREQVSHAAEITKTILRYKGKPEQIIWDAYNRAQAEVDAFAPKFEEKLGAGFEVETASGSNGDWVITGTRDGKSVRIEQTVVWKTSHLGTDFVQFPSRLYIDGTFVSEAEYRKAFV